MTKQATLYYIHDPMCSWCWGFRPVWQKLQQQLPGVVSVRYLLGGLAHDTSEPMPDSMRVQLQKTWRTIQQHIPGTELNFDFWTLCEPRRSTFASCRAVIAARLQDSSLEKEMIYRIQQAYYLEARNPSDDEILIEIASEIGLDAEDFKHDLNSAETNQQLTDEIQLSDQLAAQGYPSLVLVKNDEPYFIELDYRNVQPMLDKIINLLAAN